MKRALMMAALALVASVGFVSAASAEPAARKPGTFQVGVGIHVGQNRNGLLATETALSDGGFTSFRDEVFWHRLEVTKGVLEFPDSLEDLDQLVTNSVERGVRPLLILNYGNRFYDGGGLLSSAEGIAAYARYVRFVVRHFKGRVDQFEIWNEWNIGGGGTEEQRAARYGSPEDYVRVLSAAYSVIKVENASARVIGGSFAGYDYRWVEAFGRAGGFSLLDGFSTHPYVFAEGKKGTPASAIKHLEQLKRVIDRIAPGRNVPIYITETGWPVHAGEHGISEQDAAAYLSEFMALAKERPWIAGVWWYDLFDDGDDAANKEHRFGLITRGGMRRPAFEAVRNVSEKKAGS